MEEVNDIVWKLFCETGQIGYYMLYKSLENDYELERTEENCDLQITAVQNKFGSGVLCEEREL